MYVPLTIYLCEFAPWLRKHVEPLVPAVSCRSLPVDTINQKLEILTISLTKGNRSTLLLCCEGQTGSRSM